MLAKGRRIFLEGADMDENAPFRARRAALPEGRGAISAQNGAVVGKKGALLYQKNAFAGRSCYCPYSAFGAKMDRELRWTAK